MSYTILSLNCLTDHLYSYGNMHFHKRELALKALLNQEKPDIIAAQEVSETIQHSSAFSSYQMVGKKRGSLVANEYVPVFFLKERFQLLEEKTIWLSPTPQKENTKFLLSMYPRIVTITKLEDTKEKHIFYFCSTHLDHLFASIRKQQVDILLQQLLPLSTCYPLLCAGDFNANSKEESIKLMLEHYQDAVHPSLGSTLLGKIGSKRYHNYPIDHIFYTKHFQLLSIKKIDTSFQGIYPSDHYPLLAKVDFIL